MPCRQHLSRPRTRRQAWRLNHIKARTSRGPGNGEDVNGDPDGARRPGLVHDPWEHVVRHRRRQPHPATPRSHSPLWRQHRRCRPRAPLPPPNRSARLSHNESTSFQRNPAARPPLTPVDSVGNRFCKPPAAFVGGRNPAAAGSTQPPRVGFERATAARASRRAGAKIENATNNWNRRANPCV
jgi:hypothetical protein